MMFRLLAISVLSLEVFVSPARAIPKAPVTDTPASVQQPPILEEPLSRTLMGIVAIGFLGTPVIAYLLYKQHLAYKKAIRHNCIESLERAWRMSSKSR